MTKKKKEKKEPTKKIKAMERQGYQEKLWSFIHFADGGAPEAKAFLLSGNVGDKP